MMSPIDLIGGTAATQWSPADESSDWPLQSRLVLGALPGAVPCARLHARQVVWEWGLAALAPSCELLVSELMSNAVRVSADAAPRQHGMLGTGIPRVVELCLACDRRKVLVQVRDSCPGTPMRPDAELDAESGRGLMLVEHLSARWGCYTPHATVGKVAWALLTQATL
jgi:Histidine kinase-like ATPase domain